MMIHWTCFRVEVTVTHRDRKPELGVSFTSRGLIEVPELFLGKSQKACIIDWCISDSCRTT